VPDGSRVVLPGVVFDAGVVLQAALRPRGPAGRLVSLIDQSLFVLYISEEGVAECEDVLSRPSIRAKNPHLTPELASALVTRLRDHATLRVEVRKHFTYPRDPDDEHVINLAIEADVSYLVSRDKDLLDLMDEDHPAGKNFRNRFPHLKILDPVAFLRELEIEPLPSTPSARAEREGKLP
jgi:putative PIN family toxin of toxin-antitoxin system